MTQDDEVVREVIEEAVKQTWREATAERMHPNRREPIVEAALAKLRSLSVR